ncbi:MAG: Gfo/Idh/MocA family oxidoreductase [Oscillospiraceae bacterium]|jgi:predicted dehydrogenase|nr:Gfo/Idh/MocA family oxidoreductase [Oscillospiraceae bacterium]
MGTADKAKLKVGIIGCGGIANGKHMPNLKKLKEVEMVAFCDIVEEKAAEAAGKFGEEGAKTYVDYKELLADPAIDVVHVCTPNRSHSFITVDALEAGKHVMCEKPMAKTYADAKRMLEAAQRTGKKLTIGYQQRWRGDSLYLKEMCDEGELGEIYYARAVALRRRAVPTWGVFLNEFEQGGGPLIDIGTHALDLTLWLMDNYKPRMVVGTSYRKLADQTRTGNAWGDWDPEKFTTEDSCFGFIVMEDGATISLESSWALNIAQPDEAVCLLAGTKAGADMLDPDHELRINSVKHGRQCVEYPNFKAGGVAFFEGSGSDNSELEARGFYKAILEDTPVPTKPEQAIVVTQILEAIYESAKTGKPVYF